MSASECACSIALIGNPNTGKSTLFGALAGVRQRVGNYPGVTVEKKIGHMSHGGTRYELIDLPGTYSLAPRSPDEMVAVDVLLGSAAGMSRPDAVVCIVDASNLERNLYLVSQVLELGLPVVLALNMIDVARTRNVAIDASRLGRQLELPVVETQANRRIGVAALKDAIAAAANGRSSAAGAPRQIVRDRSTADAIHDRPHLAQRDGPSLFPREFSQEVDEIASQLANDGNNGAHLPRYLVTRLLLDSGGYVEEIVRQRGAGDIMARVETARRKLTEAGCPVPGVEATSRYAWVNQILDGVVARPAERTVTGSDRLDHLLTHKWWGTLVFAVVMVIVFQSVFRWAVWPMDAIDAGMAMLGDSVASLIPPGALQSLLVDGVIAGVGMVLVFLPQIFILFFFIAVLEDCGYMARAAYLMDKLMLRVGLSGKSFIPLLSSFACAIPGVMATRVIEDRRDRLTTILVAPLMSCSARLPVYTVLIAAFVPRESFAAGWLGWQGLTLLAMYLVGIVAAVFVALALKKTILKGETPPFVMELPSYKWPSLRTVLHRMADRGWAFVRRAGTLILAVSIVVWAALYFPHNAAVVEAPFRPQIEAITAELDALPANHADRPQLQAELDQLQNDVAGAYQRQSVLGRAGQFIEPAVRPLGWDWRIGCAAIASFPAREVVVATLGIIFNLGGEIDADEDAARLQSALRSARWEGTDRPLFNVPVALSIMVFFALCAQCGATLAVIKRETNSWWWPLFTFSYMTTLAYVGAMVTYHVGMWIAA